MSATVEVFMNNETKGKFEMLDRKFPIYFLTCQKYLLYIFQLTMTMWCSSVLIVKSRNKQNFTNFYSREFSKCYINNFISLSHSFILLHYSLFIFHIIVQDYSACTTVDKFQNSIQSNTRIWIRSPLSALFLQPFVWRLHYILFSVWF